MDDLTDLELVENARSGVRSAFDELHRRHRSTAKRVASRHTRCHASADDIVAASFAAVFAAIMNGRGPTDSFAAYLHTTTRNMAAAHARNSKQFEALLDIDIEDPTVLADELAPLGELMSDAFGSLTDSQQRVLWMSEVEDASVAEIAEEEDLSPNAVSAKAYRARQRLTEEYSRRVAGTSNLCEWYVSITTQTPPTRLPLRQRLVVDTHHEECGTCAQRATCHQDIPNFGVLLVFGIPAALCVWMAAVGPFAQALLA